MRESHAVVLTRLSKFLCSRASPRLIDQLYEGAAPKTGINQSKVGGRFPIPFDPLQATILTKTIDAKQAPARQKKIL
jgi:hypothetical protein